MQKQNLEFTNTPRVILYISGIIICAVLLYIHFFVTPTIRTKASTINKITFFCDSKQFSEAFESCRELILYTDPALGHFWMGKCYDTLRDHLHYCYELKKDYLKKQQDPNCSMGAKLKISEALDIIDNDLKKWDKPLEYYQSKAFEFYQKALTQSKDTDLVLAVAQEHQTRKRYGQALEIINTANQTADQKSQVLLQLCRADIVYYRDYGDEAGRDAAEKQCVQAIEKFSAFPAESSDPRMEGMAANCYMQLAAFAQIKKDSEKMRQFLEQAFKLTPKDPRIHYSLGKLFFEQKEYVKAEEIWQTMMGLERIDLHPLGAQAYYLRSVTQAHLWRRIAALESLKKALFYAKGNAQLQILQRAIHDPVWQQYKNDPYYLILTNCGKPLEKQLLNSMIKAIYYAFKPEKDDFDRAIYHCDKILMLDHNNYLGNLVQLYSILAQKRHRLEWEKYLQEKEEQLKNPDLHAARKNQIKIDIEARRKEIDLQSDSVEEIENKIKTSEEKLQTLIQSDAHRVMWIYCYFRWNFFDKIQTLLEKQLPSVETKGLRGFCNFMQGYAYAYGKKYTQAVECYQQAENETPGYPLYILYQAQTWEQVPDISKAGACYARLTKIAGHVPDFHYLMAQFYTKQKDYPVAREFFMKCLELKPNMYMARYELSKLYLVTGDKNNALKMLDSAFQCKGARAQINGLIHTEDIWKKHIDKDILDILRKYPQQN